MRVSVISIFKGFRVAFFKEGVKTLQRDLVFLLNILAVFSCIQWLLYFFSFIVRPQTLWTPLVSQSNLYYKSKTSFKRGVGSTGRWPLFASRISRMRFTWRGISCRSWVRRFNVLGNTLDASLPWFLLISVCNNDTNFSCNVSMLPRSFISSRSTRIENVVFCYI